MSRNSQQSLSESTLREQGYLPTAEAATLLGVSPRTLQRKAKTDATFYGRVYRDNRGAFWFRVLLNQTEMAQQEGVSRSTIRRRSSSGAYRVVQVNNRPMYLNFTL